MELKVLSPEKHAEKEVLIHLKSQGYTIREWDRDSHGPSDIEAVKGSKHILVEVCTGSMPVCNLPLSASERAALKSRAARIGAEPVYVQVALENKKLENIEYEMLLSKHKAPVVE